MTKDDKKIRVVHLNLREEDHADLKIAAKALDQPLAVYAKTVLLNHLKGAETMQAPAVTEEKEVYVRRPRTIRRNG